MKFLIDYQINCDMLVLEEEERFWIIVVVKMRKRKKRPKVETWK